MDLTSYGSESGRTFLASDGLPPRQDVIREELAAIASGTSPGGFRPTGLRGKVRKLIAQELQSAIYAKNLSSASLEEDPSPFVRECMTMKAVRDAQGARAVSSAGSRHLSRSKSTPDKLPPLELKHNEFTRKIQFHRNANGGFVLDAPDWQTDTSTAPVLPSKHREMSKWMWASCNNDYKLYPEDTDYQTNFIDWKEKPMTRLFMNPKDEFVEYRRVKFQVGSKLTVPDRNKAQPSGKK